jgi:hypothetical protein
VALALTVRQTGASSLFTGVGQAAMAVLVAVLVAVLFSVRSRFDASPHTPFLEGS